MKCEDCELLLAQGETGASLEDHLRECAACRTLAADLAANAAVFEAFRTEELPPLVVEVPRRKLYRWAAVAAVAAALVAGMLLPRPAAAPVRPAPAPSPVSAVPRPQPLKIKMLTPDPTVVIYWIVD